MEKTELAELAQERGLWHNGRKKDVIQRLDDFNDEHNAIKREDEVNKKVKKEEEEEEEPTKGIRPKRKRTSSPVRLRAVPVGLSVFITEEQTAPSEPEMDYRNKDNSKLRALLEDRDLISDGKIREEMISLLQRTSANYESFSFDELTEKLKGRGLTNAAGCPKQVKIDRLKLNDQVDRDTANGKETQLYAMLSVYDDFGIAHITEEFEEAQTTNKFSPGASSVYNTVSTS